MLFLLQCEGANLGCGGCISLRPGFDFVRGGVNCVVPISSCSETVLDVFMTQWWSELVRTKFGLKEIIVSLVHEVGVK